MGEPWHERLVVEVLDMAGQLAVIMTPDHDIYCEVLAVPPLRNLRVTPGPGWRDNGVMVPVHADLGANRRQPVYRFSRRPPRATLDEARRVADFEIANRGAQPPADDLTSLGAAGFGVAPLVPLQNIDVDRPPPRPFRDDVGAWMVIDCSDLSWIGQTVLASSFVVVHHLDRHVLARLTSGSNAVLKWIPGEAGRVSEAISHFAHAWNDIATDGTDLRAVDRVVATTASAEQAAADSEDVRTLAVRWQSNGVRMRPFGEAVGLMVEESFAVDDFPLSGPRVGGWMMRSIANSGTTPIMRHSKWTAESGVGGESRSAHEHFLLSHIIEKACVYDQLNIMNCSCIELVVRRMILLEEAHSINAQHPNFEGAEHWLGLGERRAGVLIPPSLSQFVAKKVAEDTAVQKERRKAREERKLAGAAPKSKGKGGKDGSSTDAPG